MDSGMASSARPVLADIDTVSCVCLSPLIRGEDFDGAINARDGK